MLIWDAHFFTSLLCNSCNFQYFILGWPNLVLGPSIRSHTVHTLFVEPVLVLVREVRLFPRRLLPSRDSCTVTASGLGAVQMCVTGSLVPMTAMPAVGSVLLQGTARPSTGLTPPVMEQNWSWDGRLFLIDLSASMSQPFTFQ